MWLLPFSRFGGAEKVDHDACCVHFDSIDKHIDCQQVSAMVGFSPKSEDTEPREKNPPRGNCFDSCGGLVRSGECVLHSCGSGSAGAVDAPNFLVGQTLSLEDR